MRILYVEDYKILRESVAQGIRETGWIVDAVDNGEEGLWMATETNYDALVLDLMLPKMSGLEILKEIRKKNNQVPVIILTAKDGLEDRISGLDSGADDYLVKPFYINELISRLNALFRRSYQQKHPLVQVDDIEIDTITKSVSRSGEEIALTLREYNLLEYLARRMGEVVSRTDIWEHVYDGYSNDSTSNVVDVYIGYLRKKLNINDQKNLIHTKRGMGYILKSS
jgi:DNA-binding response OmpR family regulator